MKLPTLTCLRCGASWVPRISAKPLRCPRCGSAAWDKPKDKAPSS